MSNTASFSDYMCRSIDVLEQAMNDVALSEALESTIKTICEALSKGLPLLICGNGGSASDAQHIAGELVGRYLKERKALNVICLADNAAVLTALGNDYGYDKVFSRQVEAYGCSGGVLLGISTSGNSVNVVNAFVEAKKIGLTTISLTGSGGKLKDMADISLAAPSTYTPFIQQAHLCIYHYLCQEIETRMSVQ
jgi:D-sedoheptulose 7-phosphate isomerase